MQTCIRFAFLFLKGIFVLLRRYISILLLLSLITSNTEFHQLVKLPFLLLHFSEHRTEDAGLSFADFISLHYNSESSTKNTAGHEHTKLPFKSHECHHFAQIMIAVLHTPVTAVAEHNIPHRQKAGNEPVYLSEIHKLIWQPPQAV